MRPAQGECDARLRIWVLTIIAAIWGAAGDRCVGHVRRSGSPPCRSRSRSRMLLWAQPPAGRHAATRSRATMSGASSASPPRSRASRCSSSRNVLVNLHMPTLLHAGDRDHRRAALHPARAVDRRCRSITGPACGLIAVGDRDVVLRRRTHRAIATGVAAAAGARGRAGVMLGPPEVAVSRQSRPDPAPPAGRAAARRYGCPRRSSRRRGI